MDEADDPKSKVVRLPRNVDSSGKVLRKEGPCYICDRPTAYGYSGRHVRYGDAWIDKWSIPAVRAVQIEQLKSGIFLRQRMQGQNTLRQLLKFVCRPCLTEMEDRLWPEAEARERAESQRRLEELRDLEAQRNPPRPDYGVRMAMLSDREIEIRLGDIVIGSVDYDPRTSRLRVILGDAYLGTDLPHVWTGGPAAVEIDLQEGIERMRGAH